MSVSHSILDLKLQALGMTGSALEWIKDYLKDRKQFAIVNGCKSELNDVNCGIPQGSLLGPRLFPVYVNDLPDQIKEGEIDMYADDTTLFYIGSSVDAVCDGLNPTLGDVHNWCKQVNYSQQEIRSYGNEQKTFYWPSETCFTW